MSRRSHFIERTLAGAVAFFKNSLFAETCASANGLLQRWDPAFKTAVFAVLIVGVLLARDLSVLFGLYAFCLLLSLASGIRLGFFLARTWIFIPLFSLLIALPALFNFVSPGQPLWIVPGTGGQVALTRPGLASAGFFVMRVLTSVSLAVLLSLTTRHAALLKVLRHAGVPAVFVMTLGMCYRYLYLFLTILENTYVAIKSRVGVMVSAGKGREVVAWNIAVLWRRSAQLQEDVYRAMLARGYRGES